MQLDAGLGRPKLRPIEYTHTEIYRGRVKCVEFAIYAKLTINSSCLCFLNHVVGKFFKYMPISERIRPRKSLSRYDFFTETEMKRFFVVGRRYCGKLAKTPASLQLSKYKDKQLIPVGHRPTGSLIDYTILDAVIHDPFEFPLWQKVSDLTKYVSSCIHEMTNFGTFPKIVISKVRQGFEGLNIA
jgi:hypothetical protein